MEDWQQARAQLINLVNHARNLIHNAQVSRVGVLQVRPYLLKGCEMQPVYLSFSQWVPVRCPNLDFVRLDRAALNDPPNARLYN
jgi:hypothetical protein